ncbi:MAG: globin [Planctomycetes bacterium]|nr:globin [Planctomycetota bacterium]
MSESASGPETVFERVGESGLRNLVAAFYRQIPKDDLLGPMYPAHDLGPAERRLADFLIYRFGGPETYIQERGNPKLRMRHMPFAIDQAARDRWIQLMDAALAESNWPLEVVSVVKPFLHDVATFLINRA